MLFGFDGHAIPVDETMLAYLKEHHIVEEGTSIEDTQKFLEHAVKSEEHYDLFSPLSAERRWLKPDRRKRRSKRKCRMQNIACRMERIHSAFDILHSAFNIHDR